MIFLVWVVLLMIFDVMLAVFLRNRPRLTPGEHAGFPMLADAVARHLSLEVLLFREARYREPEASPGRGID